MEDKRLGKKRRVIANSNGRGGVVARIYTYTHRQTDKTFGERQFLAMATDDSCLCQTHLLVPLVEGPREVPAPDDVPAPDPTPDAPLHCITGSGDVDGRKEAR